MRMARNAILAMMVLPAAAFAHPIVIHNGEVDWDDRGLRISLTFDEHSLRHETDAIGGGATPDEVIRMLAGSIKVVTPDRGSIIPASCDEITDDHSMTCDYDIPPETSAVALLHQPTNRAAVLPRQFQLSWRFPTGESTRVIRLTSRGNHAVLLRDQPSDKTALVDPFNEPVIRLYAINKSVAHIQIDYPLAILATWPRLLTVDSDMVTTQQFEQSRSAIAKWAIERLIVSSPNQSQRPLNAPLVVLLDPVDNTIVGATDYSRSIYTTRVRIGFNLKGPESVASIKWTGFNAAVLRVPVLHVHEDAESLIGIVSTSQPALTIEHPASKR